VRGLTDGGGIGGREGMAAGGGFRFTRSGACAVGSSTKSEPLSSSASGALPGTGVSSGKSIEALISSADANLARPGGSRGRSREPSRAAPSVQGGGCVTALGVVAVVEGTTIGGRSTSALGRTSSDGGIPPSNASVARPLIDVADCGGTACRVPGSGRSVALVVGRPTAPIPLRVVDGPGAVEGVIGTAPAIR
jgi:hypothetical protein